MPREMKVYSLTFGILLGIIIGSSITGLLVSLDKITVILQSGMATTTKNNNNNNSRNDANHFYQGTTETSTTKTTGISKSSSSSSLCNEKRQQKSSQGTPKTKNRSATRGGGWIGFSTSSSKTKKTTIVVDNVYDDDIVDDDDEGENYDDSRDDAKNSPKHLYKIDNYEDLVKAMTENDMYILNDAADSNDKKTNDVGADQFGDIIVYASQGPASTYPILKERFEKLLDPKTYRLFYHSFDVDCDGCIFQHKTSFAEGKNILMKAIVSSEEFERFKYIALFDDDALLWNRHLNDIQPPIVGNKGAINLDAFHNTLQTVPMYQEIGWTTLHDYLTLPRTAYPLLKPQFFYVDNVDVTDTYQSCTDENFWIVRRDHLHIFFPYITTIAREMFWMSAITIFRVLERCYPGAFKVLHEWSTGNPSHRYEMPIGSYFNSSYVIESQKLYLEKRLPEMRPWIIPNNEFLGFIQQRCTVKQIPSEGYHPRCAKYTKLRWDQWLNGTFLP